MTIQDFHGNINKLSGIDISPTLILNITDKIIHLAEQWQNRPIEQVYRIFFFNVIHYKVTSEGKVKNKASYT